MTTAHVRRRVTIHDVARHAGVSITTVSHALNGKGVVADATRARVVDSATTLGYSPDVIARGLRKQSLGLLGLVIRPLDTLDSYQPEGVDYFVRFAGGAAVEALDRGFGLMLVRDPTTSNVPGIALAVDGFIISDPVASDPVIELLNRNGIPLVTVGRDIERSDFTDWVEPGSSSDLHAVTAHLIDRGARRVALVTGTDANAWNVDTERAYRGWASARGQEPVVYSADERSGEAGGRAVAEGMLAAAGLAAAAGVAGAGVAGAGAAAAGAAARADALTGSGPLPDAIYCLTGRHAAGLQSRLQEAGLAVPRDVMIVAGSDSEQTRNSAPPITSVDLTPEVTAAAAVDFLLLRLAGDMESVAPLIENVLRLRESTNRR